MAAVFLRQRYLETPVIALLLLLLGEELSETSGSLWGCLLASSHVVFPCCCHTCLVEVSGILDPLSSQQRWLHSWCQFEAVVWR